MAMKQLRLVISALLSLWLIGVLLVEVFSFSEPLFSLELFGVVVLTVLVVFALALSRERAGSILFLFLSLASFANALLLWEYFGLVYWSLLIASGLLLLLHLPRMKSSQRKVVAADAGLSVAARSSAPSHSMVMDTKSTEKSAGKVGAGKNTGAKKYVAGKRGKYYHAAGSEWAEKVKPKNAVFFSSKKEAEAAGYKAHKLVK